MSEEWTPKRVSALIALWQEGLATSEIGRRLGVTKNAVIGKVHRLGLPKRQSPIQSREGEVVRRRKVRKTEAPAEGEVIRLDQLSYGMCSWPYGEPGTDEFRFCGRSVVPDKPYCAEHCERAYVRSAKDSKKSRAA